jgi:hypothetical protein
MDPLPCPGAKEPGLTSCPEDLLAITAVVADAPDGTSVWWWFAVLAFVLAAGGGAFLLLQRRTGVLATAQGSLMGDFSDTGSVHLSGLDTDLHDPVGSPRAPSSPSSAVIEWDEAIDGVLGPESEPPPAPS